MWILISAVATASLLGSMHCVGMCGPLAIWASGAGESVSKPQLTIATSMYHAGRLITYALAGVIAGTIGSFVEIGGDMLGFQLAAARVVGAVMIGLGVWKLIKLGVATWLPGNVTPAVKPSRVGGLLAKARPFVFRLPLAGRALAVGLLTTFLPCGWLYLFALVAAATGSPSLGGVTMAAFWLGTVPALTALVAGTQTLSRKFVRIVPAGAASMLIITGCFTASGRGFADLKSITEIQESVTLDLQAGQSTADTIRSLTTDREEALPCCVDETAETCCCDDKAENQ